MWTYDDEFSSLFLNLNKIFKNSTPGKVACTWHIERVQIDAIKFERTQIHFFTDVFTAVIVILAEGLFFMHLFITYGDRLCTVILTFGFETKNL